MGKKLENKIKATLNHNKKTECFYTADGNIFFNENYAKIHANQIDSKVEKYVLKPEKNKENGTKD